VNVYLPDALAARARASGLNVSALTREAVTSALARSNADQWVDRLNALPSKDIAHQRLLDAIDAAREELGAGPG
jgi:post-segregation antitoxin (ccd killing protein)